MSRRSPDGESRLVFVPEGGLADPTAPEDDELNAVTVIFLSGSVLDYDFPESGQTVDSSDMGSSFNKQSAGTYGGDTATINFHRDSVAARDAAWRALPRLTRGHFVERLFGGEDVPFAAGDEVDIYPGEVSSRSMTGRQRNTTLRGTVNVAIDDEPLHEVEVQAAA